MGAGGAVILICIDKATFKSVNLVAVQPRLAPRFSRVEARYPLVKFLLGLLMANDRAILHPNTAASQCNDNHGDDDRHACCPYEKPEH